MIFSGDMKNMQVFYGLYGYGLPQGTKHSVTFSCITTTGTLCGFLQVVPEAPLGAVAAGASLLAAFGLYVGLRRRKLTTIQA